MNSQKYILRLRVLDTCLILAVFAVHIVFLISAKNGCKMELVRIISLITLILLGLCLVLTYIIHNSDHERADMIYADVTGLQNKLACLEKLRKIGEADSTYGIGIAMFDINNLKIINDVYGHAQGDRMIFTFARLLLELSADDCFIGRYGGDEFILIHENSSPEKMEAICDKLRLAVDSYNLAAEHKISYAYGYEVSTESNYYLINDLLHSADEKMYRHKMQCKNTCCDAELSKNNDGASDLKIQNHLVDDLSSNKISLLYAKDFEAQVEREIKNGGESDNLALMQINISNFRYINEFIGRDVGDNILNEIACELANEANVLCSCRYFNDRFAFLQRFEDEDGEVDLQKLNKKMERMQEYLNSQGIGGFCSMCIGVYIVNSLDDNAARAIDCAGHACQIARGKYCRLSIYSEDSRKNEARRMLILKSFRKALDKEEFEPYLQPQIDSVSGEIVSVEALVRWKKDGRQFYYPDEFIPILEETNDVIELDYYMYEKTFKWLSKWNAKADVPLQLSLNVSRCHILNITDFCERVSSLMSKYNIFPGVITFEITEGDYMLNQLLVQELTLRLHEIGCLVSLDDFGSGYSSLNSINILILDEIKIDKEFARNGIDKNRGIVLSNVINMIRKLEKTVVCEGVETEKEADKLKKMHCDRLQGYYYARPMPISEFEEKYGFSPIVKAV